MTDKPKLVGVTGGIGSGKSTVCKIFEVLGHQVYYADDRAKWLMENDEKLVASIKSLFGENAYENNRLNRKFIADQVFKSPELLEKLNGTVHPAVGEDLVRWVQDNHEQRLLFDEAALLFENGSYKKMEATILVTAPEELRIKRVVTRDDHRTEASVKEIIDKQMKDSEKEPLADFIIRNDGSASVIRQVMEVYKNLI